MWQRHESGQRRHRKAPLAVVAALLLFCACDGSLRTPAAVPSQLLEEPVIDVQTAPLRRGSIASHLSAPGSVEARRESRIGAEIAGRIVRVHVHEGDRVEAGAPLFEIDPTPYQMALRQAEAGLDVARAEAQQVDADLRRAQKLRRQNVLAQQEIERLSTTLAVALAHERQATEAVALARNSLERTVVRAPYGGSVAERLVDEGTTALVQPQTIIVVLQETAELEARAAIPESQLSLVRTGDPVQVHIEGLAEPVQTHVAAVSDTIDPATRTYLVKMPVPNPGHHIKAGVFAHIEIQPRNGPEMVLAPREAIRVEDGRSRLLVIRDGRAATLSIEVGAASEAEAEILAGAEVGDVAIVGGAARTIAPGMRVRAAPPPATS
jgi:RND family efflux transporter MFP subunit